MSATLPLFGAPQAQATSDDYYTPAWVFERMGLSFDLDVASPPSGIPWIPAARYFTMEDDGLTQPWTGRVWMNPPFSAATSWVRKFIEHRNGVCLVPQAKAQWHVELWDAADAVAVPHSRFTFTGGPAEGNIRFAVMFAAFGDECVEAISRLGTVRRAAGSSIPPDTMSGLEWSPGVPVTGDNLEPVFMAALEAGDVEGVGYCLRLAAAVDPYRAAQWYDDLRFAVRLRGLGLVPGDPQ